MAVDSGGADGGAAAITGIVFSAANVQKVAQLFVKGRFSRGDGLRGVGEGVHHRCVESYQIIWCELANCPFGVKTGVPQCFVRIGVAECIKNGTVHQDNFELLATPLQGLGKAGDGEFGRKYVHSSFCEAGNGCARRGPPHFAHLDVVAVAQFAAIGEGKGDGQVGRIFAVDRKSPSQHGENHQIAFAHREDDRVVASRHGLNGATRFVGTTSKHNRLFKPGTDDGRTV